MTKCEAIKKIKYLVIHLIYESVHKLDAPLWSQFAMYFFKKKRDKE